MASRCGILCPGPGFSEFLARPIRYPLTIGVNRAATAWPCDVWAFGDAETFNAFTPARTGDQPPILLTNVDAMKRLLRNPLSEGYTAVTIDTFRVPLPATMKIDASTYTLLIAIAYALDRSMQTIVLHGCDMQGTGDWDGRKTLGPNRDRARWRREAELLTELVRFACRRGVRFDGLPSAVEGKLISEGAAIQPGVP